MPQWSEAEIETLVVDLIRRTAAVSTTQVTPTTDLVLDLAFDSLRIADLAAGLEEIFGTPFHLPSWVEETGGRHSLTVGSLLGFTTRTLRG